MNKEWNKGWDINKLDGKLENGFEPEADFEYGSIAYFSYEEGFNAAQRDTDWTARQTA